MRQQPGGGSLEEKLKLLQLQRRRAVLKATTSKSEDLFPDANRAPIPFDQTEVSQEDLSQLENINQRKINQLEGRGSPIESFGDVSAQAFSSAMNPVREFFGKEAVLPGNFINPIEGWQADDTARRLKLAKAGMPIKPMKDRGVGAKARVTASLGLTKKDKAIVAQEELDEQFGEHVQIGKDSKTGEQVYLNPLNNKLYPLNPVGLDAGDFVDYLRPGVVATSEALTTILMMKKGGVPSAKKEVVAGGVGAAIGEAGGLGLGKLLGTNRELSWPGVVWEGMKEGGFSIAAGGILEGLVQGYRKVKTIKGDSVIPGHIVDQFKDDMNMIDGMNSLEAVNQHTIDTMNKSLRDLQSEAIVQPNVGQILDDDHTLNIVESLKTVGDKSAAPLNLRDKTNDAAFVEYFDLIGKEVVDTPAVGKTQLAEEIQAVTGKSISEQTEVIEAPLREAEKLSRGTIQAMPKGKTIEAGREAKNALTVEETAFYKFTEKDYDEIASEAEALNLVPDSFNLKLKLAGIDKSQSAAKGRKFSQSLEDDALDINYDWSFTRIDDTIKGLREQKRLADRGQKDYNLHKLNKGIEILKDFRAKALKDNPLLLQKLELVESTYREGKDLLGKGVSKLILKTDDVLADSEIFKKIIIAGDSGTSAQVADGIRNSPEAMLSMRAGINKFYKNEVSSYGIVDLKKHNDFVEKYINSEIITPFYTKKQLRQIRKPGAAGRIYKAELEKRNVAIKKINDLFESKVNNLNPTTLFNKIWGESKEIDIKKMRNVLSDHPDIWKSVKAEALNDIKLKIMPLPNSTISYNALSKVLSKNKGSIIEMFGEGYFNNLTLLRDSLEITSKRGKSFNFGQGNAVMDITRSYVGVFTREGRFITAANRYRTARSRKLLAEMVLDPDKIRKLSALKRARSGSDTARLILTQLGASGLYHINDSDLSPKDFEALSEQITMKKNKDKFDAKKQTEKNNLKRKLSAKKIKEEQLELQKYFK